MLKIYFLNGPEKGKILELKGNTAYVGRLSDNDVQIKDKTVSRKHLRIKRKGDVFVIRDLKSKNGTYLKGKAIETDVDYEIDVGVPFAVGKVVISLGVKGSEEIFTNDEMTDLTDEFSSTMILSALKDRPMTPPKNMDFFYKVSNVLNQSLDINEIMRKVLDYIFELLKRIDRGYVILVDSDRGEYTNVISRFAQTEDNDDMHHKFSRTIVNGVIKSGRAITILDTFGQDDADVSDSMELMHVKSVMCVPLISKSKVRGVIYIDSINIPYGFREQDLALISALSSPAAIAIENALLYSNMERLVDERTNNLINTEKMLGESQKRFQAMFNNLSSGVVVLKAIDDGEDFLILDSNRANMKIEKIKKKEVIGRNITNVFPEIADSGLLNVIKRVWETGKPERCSITVIKDEERPSWREYFIYTLPDNEIVAIFDDVTDKKQAEMEQKALQKQLFAAQKMETIGAFAGGTAHNFRNILQAISGNVEYLEVVYGERPEVRELAKNIYSSIDRGVGLINSLLHFAKQGWELEMQDLDLSDVILKTHEIIERVFNKNIKIELALEKNLTVKGNLSLLSQAFMNLFTNARDAMPGGGDLIIKAAKNKNRIIASVTDTGHGIEDDVIDKIFDPFFTLKDVGSGTGLGLSTTLGIVERHKGSITVSSKPGKGSTFKISLPAVAGKIDVEYEIKDEIVYGNNEKILVIDDEPIVLNSIVHIINHLGYMAIPLNRSVDTVAAYRKHKPDLVLVDRNMPEPDGIACITKLVEIDRDVKIIIISGYEDSESNNIDEKVKSAVKGYLVKPCGASALSSMISRILGS